MWSWVDGNNVNYHFGNYGQRIIERIDGGEKLDAIRAMPQINITKLICDSEYEFRLEWCTAQSKPAGLLECHIGELLRWLQRGDDEHYKLYEISVDRILAHSLQYQLSFHFYDQFTPNVNSIGNLVIFTPTRKALVEAEISGPDGSAWRRLRCEFGDDAALGKFVDITEWCGGQGMSKVVLYPNAKADNLNQKCRVHALSCGS